MTDAVVLKKPPHSLEAEQAVLGGLMLDEAAWDKAVELVAEEDFYRKDHRLVFRAIAKLAEESRPRDALTVSEMLTRLGELDEVGGLAYIGELVSNTPSAANIGAYAEVVRERSVLRQLIRISYEISDDAYEPRGKSAQDVLDTAEQKIFAIAEQGATTDGPQRFKAFLAKTLDRVDRQFQSPDTITGVTTGIKDLDEATLGLQDGELVIVAARPSMGKTAFALNLVESAITRADTPVLVFSMEMPGESLSSRMAASVGKIDFGRIRSGKLDDEDWPRFTAAMATMAAWPLVIDDTPALSPLELRARARRVAREHGGRLGMVVVDYLQLMRVPGLETNRVAEISEISRSLKALAKELGCPVVALSQLNRSLEQRPNKRPVMSDLRESGAIEQDADLIMFIYRDEVYFPDTQYRGIAEIIIGKQRNGPIKTVPVAALLSRMRFADLEKDSWQSAHEAYNNKKMPGTRRPEPD